MLPLLDFYKKDFTDLNESTTWAVHKGDNTPVPPIHAAIYQNFTANSKYWAFYIPQELDPIQMIKAILEAENTNNCVLSSNGDTTLIICGFAGLSEKQSSTDLVFNRAVHIYTDHVISDEVRIWAETLGKKRKFRLTIRDQQYAKVRSESSISKAFISHSSEDKDTLVRGLAKELRSLLCPVWYDEYSLQVGDSLIDSIDKGLKEVDFCILIISPNFIRNKGYCKAEFNSIFSREMHEEKKFILPIWHNVTRQQVFDYNASLVDRFALNSEIGIKELANKLNKKLKSNPKS